jgi:hypothetical protein
LAALSPLAPANPTAEQDQSQAKHAERAGLRNVRGPVPPPPLVSRVKNNPPPIWLSPQVNPDSNPLQLKLLPVSSVPSMLSGPKIFRVPGLP